MATAQALRLTQYASGGGCACKIPPGELERAVAGLIPQAESDSSTLLIGLDTGDDAAVIQTVDGRCLVATTDFFTPVVDDAYDFGRIAATNALSDIYAMGGTPLLALNLLMWPRDVLPIELAGEVLRGGVDVTRSAHCHLAGGHSIDDPEPKYGLAVTGTVVAEHLMRIDTGRAGLPLSITKPLGVGVLNNRHKATAEAFPQAVASMTTLNRDAAAAAITGGITCATDITGFGLLGHLHKLARSSGVTAIIDSTSVPYLDGARDSAAHGYISGGTRRNLDWVRPHVDIDAVDETESLLLADAQTSGGLLLAGTIPGATVIGELVPQRRKTIVVR